MCCSAATDWYGSRTQLVRNLEAARELAKGRTWATMLISEEPIADGSVEAVAASLDEAAPHLRGVRACAVQHAYLGNVTWKQACDATGCGYDSLPDHV